MEEHVYHDLNSEDPRSRFGALRAIRHDYSDEAGNALVRACIEETAPGVWWLAAMCTLPVWLPKLDQALSQMDRWPFSGAKTLHLLELASPWPLHSVAPFTQTWLASDEWTFKFCAVRSMSLAGVDMDREQEALEYLMSKVHSFEVPESDLSEGSWMEEFGQKQNRVRELEKRLETLGL